MSADTKRLNALLRRRLELDEALTQARREMNEAQAKLTLARRRAKAAERDCNEASNLYFMAVEAERRGEQ